MTRVTKRSVIRSALVPAAVLMAVSGSAAAFASEPAATGRSGGAAAAAQQPITYTMRLSPASATLRPGDAVTSVITFNASRRLYGYPVDLSVTGLPAGVTASFSPRRPRVGGRSTLTLTAAPSSSPSASTVTVSAIVDLFSSDPIGTTSPFDLTIDTP